VEESGKVTVLLCIINIIKQVMKLSIDNVRLNTVHQTLACGVVFGGIMVRISASRIDILTRGLCSFPQSVQEKARIVISIRPRFLLPTFCPVTVHFNPVSSQLMLFTSMKMTVFWDTAPCSLVEVYRRFRGALYLHHQGSKHF
jgi:hypothetical protein